jgi:transposase
LATTNAANERLAQHLWNHHNGLFTFLRQPGLDATNWRAELAIRFGVILRKVWGGSRTWAGARAQAVLMSVWRTCWQKGRSAVDFLSQLLRGPPSQDGALAGLNAWLASTPGWLAVGEGTLKSRDGRCPWPDLCPVLY